jgi:hypothetical protein
MGYAIKTLQKNKPEPKHQKKTTRKMPTVKNVLMVQLVYKINLKVRRLTF